MNNKFGFTIIEIIVVIAVMALFLGMTMAQFNSYNETLKVQNQAKKLMDVFELGKKKALTSDLYDNTCTNFNGYELNISASSYSLSFCCYSACTTNLQTYSLNSDITNQNISILNTGKIDFPPLMNNFKNTISTIEVKNTGINKCAVMTVSAFGIINLSDALINC